MPRKLALLFFAASVTLVTACSNISAPVRDDELDEEPCSIVVGSHTRCDDSTSSGNG